MNKLLVLVLLLCILVIPASAIPAFEGYVAWMDQVSETSTNNTIDIPAGSLIVVATSLTTAQEGITVTSPGLTFNTDINAVNGIFNQINIASSPNAPGGNTTITVSIPDATYIRVVVAWYSGMATTNVTHNTSSGSALNEYGGTTEIEAGPITTTIDNCVLFVAARTDSDMQGWVTGSDYTMVDDCNKGNPAEPDQKLCVEDRVATIGTYNANFTINKDSWVAGVVAYAPESSTPPTVSSWSNNYTNSTSISFEVPVNTEILFNATSDQTITNWTWSNADYITGNGTVNSNASKIIIDDTSVSVYGTNSNGTSNTITWAITIPHLEYTVGDLEYPWIGNTLGEGTILNRDTSRIMLRQYVDNYTSYWRFGNSTGTIAYDENTTTNNNGALQGNTFWNASGKFGKSISFPGDVGDIVLFTQTNYGTVHSISFYIDYFDPVDGVVIGNTPSNGYAAYIDATDIYYSTGGANYVTVAHGGLTPGVFYYMTIIRNGTLVSFYKDNVQIGTTQTLGNDNDLTLNSFGGYSNNDLDQTVTTCRLSDIRIYNRVISTSENSLTMNNTMLSSGNRTTWHNATSGYENYFWSMNATLPTNTNVTVTAYDNDSSVFVQQWTGITNSYSNGTLTGTKPQDIKYNITLNGNTTVTPEIINFTFYTQEMSSMLEIEQYTYSIFLWWD